MLYRIIFAFLWISCGFMVLHKEPFHFLILAKDTYSYIKSTELAEKDTFLVLYKTKKNILCLKLVRRMLTKNLKPVLSEGKHMSIILC